MARAPDVVETERLRAERVREGDRETLKRIWQDPEVGKTLGGTRSDAEVALLHARLLSQWSTCGYGVWIVRERATGELAGYAGLALVSAAGLTGTELLYAMLPESWNKGFTTEIGRALVDVAFAGVGLPELVAYTLPTNVGSRRVMEKLGFRYEREIVHAGLPHVLYRLRARDGAPP